MAVLMREAIGDTLRRVRTARRRTLRDVSRRARVSLGYLSEVERGRKEPSSELLAAICAALDLALHDLLGEAAELMARDALVLSRAAQVTRPIGLRHASLRFAADELAVRPIGAAGDPLVSGAPETTGAPMISAPTAAVGFTASTKPTMVPSTAPIAVSIMVPSAMPHSIGSGGRPVALAAVGGVRIAA